MKALSIAALLAVSLVGCAGPEIRGSWTDSDWDCEVVRVQVSDADTVYADEDHPCGFCWGDAQADCGYMFAVEVPQGATDVTVTVQAFESGDDADDEPAPIVRHFAGPLDTDRDLGTLDL